MATVDLFLKMDGVPGESKDLQAQGEIDLESFSWGETNQGTAAAGGGGGAGKVSMQDFHFVTRVNKASPVLFLSCASGKHIKEAILTVRKAGKDQRDYLVFKFKDVLVSSYQIGGRKPAAFRWSRCRSTSRASTSSTARRSPTAPWPQPSRPAGTSRRPDRPRFRRLPPKPSASRRRTTGTAARGT